MKHLLKRRTETPETLQREIAQSVENGLSHRQAAEKHGVSPATVTRIMKRATSETPETLKHSSEALKHSDSRQAQEKPPLKQNTETPSATVETPLKHDVSPEELEHLDSLPADERMKHARVLLTGALWMKNPQRYTEIRVALLGATGTVLPAGTGACGLSSSLTERSQTALNK